MTDIRKKLAERFEMALEIWRKQHGSEAARSKAASLPSRRTAIRRATYREFANKVGVDPSLITCWRNGTSWPLPDKIPTVAETLGVPMEWFWTDDPHPTEATN